MTLKPRSLKDENLESDSERVGVLIIGAGPIGLELAVECRREGIGFEIIDAGTVGETMSWWAPQTRWFSSNERIAIAGVPLETPDQSKATREQYLAYLRAVAKQFEIHVRCFERAVAIESLSQNRSNVETSPSTGGWRVRTIANSHPREILCQHLILAIGGTHRPKRLGVEGEDLPHVDGYLREPHRYFGRRVLIVGGRNSAAEAALRLHHAGAAVTMSYHRKSLPWESIKYWLRPELEGLIGSGRIVAHLGTRPIRITPTTVLLQQCDEESEPFSSSIEAARQYREQDDRSTLQVDADDVLSLIGYEQDKSLFSAAGIELRDPGERPVFDESTMQTNVAGIYVAGTAVAGTQSSQYKVFLENCHVHVRRIIDHLRGRNESSGAEHSPVGPLAKEIAAMPES